MPVKFSVKIFINGDITNYTISIANIDNFFADYLQDGRLFPIQGPDLENQNSLDSGKSNLPKLNNFCL